VGAVKTKEMDVGAKWWQGFPTSPPLDVEAGLRFVKRKNRIDTPIFQGACSLAGIEPTARQARKWNNGKGLALRHKNEAKSLL
jgi:hypothetical protein